MRKQKASDNNEHIGNTRIGQKIFKPDILDHKLALLSVNQSEANNPTITDGKLVSNSLAYSHGDAWVSPGLMSSNPIHPDVRLMNMPADTEANVFGETENIISDSIIPSLALSTNFSLLPQAYAASGPVSVGGGMGCKIALGVAAGLNATADRLEMLFGGAGGGGGEDKKKKFGAGIAAGFAAVASAVNLSDCTISASEKGVMNIFDKIGLSKLTSMSMKNFDERCIPPLVETYTCTDGKIYATNIHQPTNKIEVGKCTPDSQCSADGKICLENYSYPSLSEMYPFNIYGTPTSATIYKNTLIRMSNFDDKYLEIIKRVCDSLPESFCRGAIIDISNDEANSILFNPEFRYCNGGAYWPDDDNLFVNGCPSRYEGGEATLVHLLIHELTHRVQYRTLGAGSNDFSALAPVMNQSFDYYMGWAYDRPGDAGTIPPEAKIEKIRQVMQEFYFSIDGYNADPEYIEALVNHNFEASTENFADLAAVYYADSLKFKGIFPELYRYYRDLVFQGREYKDGVWINP